ncbi:VP5 [Gokushovirus WZ-2015a]|nr:VP5 [Gokushovirus WZ-2015a]
MDFIKAQLLKEDKRGGFQQGDENLEYDEAPVDITEILQAAEMAEDIKNVNDYLSGLKAQEEVKKDEKEVNRDVAKNDDKIE